MAHIFVSYAREDDEPFVEDLHRDLTASGFGIWWDKEAMASRGRSFLQEIRDAISAAERLILVVGPKALRSDYVSAEWELALELCVPVLPILRLGDFDSLPRRIANLHCPDLRPARRYEDGLAEVVRLLHDPLPSLAPLVNVDSLPRHYLPRPSELARLAELLLADIGRPTVIRSTRQTASLQGMAGIGKSVLAAAFARACETRRAFADGIWWLRIGPEPEMLSVLQLLGSMIDDVPLQRAASLPLAAAALGQAMQQKSCLLVLDDVWNVSAVDVFLNGLGPRCRLLMTTRDGGLATSVGAAELPLDVLGREQALALLASWSGLEVAALPPLAAEVAEECGYLPLALAIIGAVARGNPARWENLLLKLRAADLQKIRREFPNYPYPDLFRALQVSLDAMGPREQAAYLDLAVFRSDFPIPESAAAAMWAARGFDLLESQDTLDLFVDRSLGRRNASGHLVLHSLQADFVRISAPDLPALHRDLLAGYLARCPAGWSGGPDDGYFYQHLPYHLNAAGDSGELISLLTSFDWLAAKLAATDVHGLRADFGLAHGEPGLPILRQAVELSAHVLAQDRRQLASQLAGRLLGLRDGLAERLLESIANHEGVWLRPLAACLVAPGGAIVATFLLHTDRVNAIAMTPDGSLAVSASRDQTLKVWDLDSLQLRCTLAGHSDEVTAVVVTADGKYAISGAGKAQPFKVERLPAPILEYFKVRESRDTSIRVWDLKNGSELRRLGSHAAAVRALMFIDHEKGLISGGDDSALHLWMWQKDSEGIALGDQGGRVVLLAEQTSAARIFSFSEQNFKMWDFRKFGETAGTLGSWRNAVAMDAERLKIFLQDESFDGGSFGLLVWDLDHDDPGTEKLDSIARYPTQISTATCVPGQEQILVGFAEGEIRKIDWRRREELRILRGHREEVTSIAVSADGSRMVSSCRDGSILLWDLAKPAPEPRDFGLKPILAVALSPDGARAVSGHSDGAIGIWRTDPIELVATHQLGVGAIQAIEISPDGRLALAASYYGALALFEIAGGEVTWKTSQPGRIPGFAVDWQAAKVVQAMDKMLQVYELETGRELRRLEGHASEVSAVGLFPGALRAVSGDRQGVLICWDLETGKKVGEAGPADPGPAASGVAAAPYELTGPSMHRARRQEPQIHGLIALPGGRHAIAASELAAPRVWDLAEGVQAAPFAEALDTLPSLAAAADGSLLLAGDASGALHLWDVARREILAAFRFDAPVACCDLGKDRRSVVVGIGGDSGQIALLRLEGALPAG